MALQTTKGFFLQVVKLRGPTMDSLRGRHAAQAQTFVGETLAVAKRRWNKELARGFTLSGSNQPTKCRQILPSMSCLLKTNFFGRSHAVNLVEDAGYTAVEASNADEAIAILERRKDIQIVFTDINMPGSIDGLKLAHAIRKRWPPIELIVASGHFHLSDDDMPERGRFFSKPILIKRLFRHYTILPSSAALALGEKTAPGPLGSVSSPFR